ncbi:MAG: phage tail tape measure protein, partial [Sphingobium sp.]|uniref:phage tail tape measure protein n=1 Tax=Sphingobium sp. TaxID=1912891 RepID=UPI003BB0D2B9
MDKRLALLVKFAGIDQLTGKMRTIGGASKKTARDIGETRREIDRLRQAQARIAKFKDLENSLRSTSSALDTQRAKLEALGVAQAEAGGVSKKLARQIGAAEREEQRLVTLHERHGVELQQLSGKLEGVGIDVADLARHEDRLGLKLYETNKRLKEQRQELDRLGQRQARIDRAEARGARLQSAGATGLAAGAVAAIPAIGAGRKAMSFEESMAEVRKVVNFSGPAEFQRMNRDILQMSRTLPIAASGIAQIVAAGGQADIPRKELLLFARDAGIMAVAFDTEADAAGDMMAKWRSAFSLDRGGVLTLANQVNYLGNTTAAGTGPISEIVTRVGALGEVAGLNSGQIAAMAATLGSMGIESEIAATGIKNTMLALTKGEAATKGQRAALEGLGLTATDVAKRMQRDAAGTIVDVMSRIRNLPKEAQAGQLTELFGSESVAAIAPMLTQLDALKRNLLLAGDASKYAGSMQAEFDTRASTSANKLQLYRNRMEALQIVVGEKLLPHVVRLAEWGGDLADRFAAWADRNPQLAGGLTLVGSGLALMLTLFGAIGLAIGTVLGPLAKWGGLLIRPIGLILRLGALAIGAVAAVLGLPAWVVGAIALALGAAALLIYTKWEQIKAIFWKGVSALTGLHGTFLRIGVYLMAGLINGISSRIAAIRDKIVGLGRDIATWFKSALGIRSPSRVFMGLGSYLTQGLTLGIDGGAAEPIARMKRLSGQLTGALAT